ncbi:MAG TPA: zinc-binding alcohol dehydrogenase family protein [Solirubrobacteraceae bacterium]|jgi:NADPH2:quinone reductase
MITVRAARLHEHGKPLVIESVDLPEPNEDEVLVELEFGGVNPIDTYVAAGQVAAEAPLPRTLGGEASGTVDGRPVMVVSEGLGTGRDGVWAAAAVVPRAAVHELPDGVAPGKAAAMGIAGLTAWNVVRGVGRVSSEDRVLVLGASGGVGTMIVSLCKSIGAKVLGQTGREAKVALIERLGADPLVAEPDELAAALDGFEPTIAFDPLGDGFVRPVVDALVPSGRLVSFGTSAGAEVSFNLQKVYRKGLSLLGYAGGQLTPEQRRVGLEGGLRALRDGELEVVIDSVLPLDEVNEAFARLAHRSVSGNLLLALG